MMKAKPLRILTVLLVLILLAAAAWWWRQRTIDTTDPTRLILYGNIDIRQVDLAFNGAERIVALYVEEGDRVVTGQLLGQLETGRLQARVARAEAQLGAQREVVARLEAGTRAEEINQARAELELAESQLRDALRTQQRIRNLARQKVASQQQLDDAQAAADAAAARVKAARAALDLALAGPRLEDIAAARATLKAFAAELELTRHELDDASLRAPLDGIIRNRILQTGDMASPQKPVYTLALIDPVWVRAFVDEPDLGRLKPGMSATVTTDSFPDKGYAGWIGYISPSAEFTPKSVQTREVRTSLVYQLRVVVCNPQNELRLGMPATVTIDLRQPPAQSPDARERCRKPS
jgi:HlyD family secretion protein